MATPAERLKEQIKLRAAFVPCETKEALALWIAEYLGLEFPDVKVDEDSTTTPMEYIWTVYEKALKNLNPAENRILAYASRDSFKTLGTAVLEFLMLVHLGRDVGHMAAIEKQARQATGYVQNFFNKPYFRPYVVGNNQRTKEFIRYDHKETGEHITLKQWELLTPTEQTEYVEYKTKLDIVICTPQGANGLHVPFFVVDEVDLASPSAYEEAKMIPTSTDERAAITALTSTRKYAFGLVQDEIDKAPKTGLRILHWNILDIAKKCDAKRHLPEKPKKTVYVNKGMLRVFQPDEFKRLSEEAKSECVEEEAFEGCLTNCTLYAMCRGRLATVQQGPKFPQATNLQKPIDHLIGQFKAVSEPVANAQLLCRKPSQMGLIYPFLDRDVHVKTAAEIAAMITGEDSFPESFTKGDLMALLVTRGTKFVCGMDFGWTHNWACPMVAIDGRRAFVLGCLSEPQLMANQQIERFEAAFAEYNPEVFADPENPQAIKEFKDAGHDMRKWKKGPGSVLAGIEVVRWMIRPLIGEPLLYFLDGQPDIDFLFLRLQQYHWKVNPAGNPTDEPDETNDDECDALRYALMNKFINGRTTVRSQETQKTAAETLAETAQRVHKMQMLDHATGGNLELLNQGQNKPIRRGKLFFSVG